MKFYFILDIKDESETILSVEEVASLEEYIPTRHTSITLLKCTCTIFMAEFNLLDHLLPVIMGEKVYFVVYYLIFHISIFVDSDTEKGK